jgi:ceramide glucosyltransferase
MSLSTVAALTGVLLLSVAAGYSTLTLVAALVWRLRGVRRPTTMLHPAVTVLKPLCGAEPELYENLRSFCMQDYPSYQIVFGVCDASDHALAIVRQLAQEFPSVPIDIVVDDSQHGANRKVSNLINMLPYARHDILIIVDSDTRVRPDYLAHITVPLLERENGLVTCIYRSIPVGGIWSRFGCMYINDWYIPSVMLAWLFGHRGYISGQTIGVRRDTLAAAGGLRSLVNHLADDYQLGEQVRQLGLRIVLSSYAAETVQGEPTAGALMGHELRWMRTIRALAPGGFRFLFVTFTLPLLAVGYALGTAQPGWPLEALLSTTVISRIAVSCLPRLSQRRIPLHDLLLLPVRDLLLCWTWFCALVTSRVSWRGGKFQVDEQGVMRGSL